MRFQAEFIAIHAALEAGLREAAKGLEGFDSATEADDVLRLIENSMNDIDRTILFACKAIEAEQRR